ncbi:Ribonuclease Y [Fundidesulfovibrio magnetotacticus]|uniref:Ribonuclease Y n=1 Tax=Fundidesulfovibrio magnetotacticus TaxID=2730080 RepID=A0A6V8LWD3_9BACT|nr:HDIG domain-containing metalloprotein [Fundidesulfovibrio magnetotacticus]GFK96044.1 Ribonuclease Y [Fundidesulfovibrio magnetotacticus]
MAPKQPQSPPWHVMAALDPPGAASLAGLPPAPSDAGCFAFWDEYAMLPHIREHSLAVARVATTLALAARRAGLPVDVQLVRASALLHDIAKTYTIHHGGNHSQLGGAWMQERTGNPVLAMGIVHHVHWPWPVDVRGHFLPMAIIYGDKRVRHDCVVTLDERFEDLYARYGSTPYIRDRLAESKQQSLDIESALGQALGMNLHEHPFDSGRLVERA